jgi:predicted Rossmann fold nucleotide-binding protein DprA/Smf involved in DNA uptake
MTEDERHLFNYIRWDPTHVDELAAAANLNAAQAGALLTLLELKGAVRDTGGQMYARS